MKELLEKLAPLCKQNWKYFAIPGAITFIFLILAGHILDKKYYHEIYGPIGVVVILFPLLLLLEVSSIYLYRGDYRPDKPKRDSLIEFRKLLRSAA